MSEIVRYLDKILFSIRGKRCTLLNSSSIIEDPPEVVPDPVTDPLAAMSPSEQEASLELSSEKIETLLTTEIVQIVKFTSKILRYEIVDSMIPNTDQMSPS